MPPGSFSNTNRVQSGPTTFWMIRFLSDIMPLQSPERPKSSEDTIPAKFNGVRQYDDQKGNQAVCNGFRV